MWQDSRGGGRAAQIGRRVQIRASKNWAGTGGANRVLKLSFVALEIQFENLLCVHLARARARAPIMSFDKCMLLESCAPPPPRIVGPGRPIIIIIMLISSR